ncbi:hypothetical protein [Acinetobacter bereziniae]|uniref:hypothetical protein n=1 Tax=Acinetobacter bereziniae TaxID=106648 RepID=UPI00124FBD26|nr:hypothetical protein [Acinetobacter bereziniae]
MSKENSDKSVLGGVFILIVFAIYVLGVIHTANNFSKDKALSAFLIPPYGFYMGVRAIFNSNPQKNVVEAENHNSEIERLAKENVDSEIARVNAENRLKNVQNGNDASQIKLKAMEEIVNNMNQGLPHIENGIRLDKVIVIDDHTYGYESTLLNFATYTDELQKNSQALKNDLAHSACSTPNNIKAAQSGASSVFNYYANDGSLLLSLEITPADCGY